MKATIESTSEITEIDAVGHPGKTKVRVWEGVSENGVNFVAYIPLVQVKADEDNSQFETELSEHAQPSEETMRAITMRLLS